MADRLLRVAVCGTDGLSDRSAELLRKAVADGLAEQGEPLLSSIAISVTGRHPSEAMAADHHLVVGVALANPASPWVDVCVGSDDEIETLAVNRLVPWVVKWQLGRRARRAQVAMPIEADARWPEVAARLIARLRANVPRPPVLRVDHIGSTAVPGLRAKDLIDIQIMVPTMVDAETVATVATDAGFVLVSGEWFGLDRRGGEHPELVVVDADPARPVNVNIRAADNPVAREALLFRDWLRADPEARQRYATLKARLAGQQVDDYGRKKMPFISAALGEAEVWAASANWRLAEQAHDSVSPFYDWSYGRER